MTGHSLLILMIIQGLKKS